MPDQEKLEHFFFLWGHTQFKWAIPRSWIFLGSYVIEVMVSHFRCMELCEKGKSKKVEYLQVW